MLIKKIHIKHFRSIKEATIEINRCNIFVGLNDAGKSNVLKALNLFFNGETDAGKKFNWDLDFSHFATRRKKKADEIEIKLEIEFPPNFSVQKVEWKKVFRRGGVHKENIEGIKERTRVGAILKKTQFCYVPAVKSKEFFKELLVRLYETVSHSTNKLTTVGKSFSTQLKNYTKKITEDLKKNLGINSRLCIPRDMREIFKGLIFETDLDDNKKIALDLRGDGVQAMHIPVILKFIAEHDNENKRRGEVNVSTIWGYEEPENGIEMLKCSSVAGDFLKYSSAIQMFLTTHSPSFYSLGEEDKVTVFCATKKEGTSQFLNKKSSELDEHMGLMPLIAPYIKEHAEELEKTKLLKQKLEKELAETKPDKIFICEDEDLKYFWRKNFKKFSIEEIDVRTSKGCENDCVEISVEELRKKDSKYDPKIFRQIDRAGLDEDRVSILEQAKEAKAKKRNLNNYKIKYLPVYEVENFGCLAEKLNVSASDDLDKAFIVETRNVLRVASKLVPEEKKGKFKENTELELKTIAKKDVLRFFPGKELAKTRTDFDPIKKIINLPLNDYPDVLEKYIEDIKNFFNS